jgi:ADP-ribosylglycohydrolase
MAKNLLDRVYGCLIGGAIGDSLGAPVEGWYYQEIRAKYGKLEEFLPFSTGYSVGAPGTVTDDTILRHLLCLTIAKKGGRVNPSDYGKIWLEKLNPNRLWLNERLVMLKLQIGMDPWDSGLGTPPTGCASMSIAPVGIINAGNPAQAYQDGWNIAFVNQEGLNRDGAAILAAAVAAAFLPDATVESIIQAMWDYSTDLYRRAFTLVMDLADVSRDVDDFAARYYDKMLDWSWPQHNWKKERYFSGSSIEIVPIVMAIIKLVQGDINQGIIEGANFGRDCDTIGGIVGNILGAHHGASAIRPGWIEMVEKANEEYFEELEGDPKLNFLSMAQRMTESLCNQRSIAEQQLSVLDQIIHETTSFGE